MIFRVVMVGSLEAWKSVPASKLKDVLHVFQLHLYRYSFPFRGMTVELHLGHLLGRSLMIPLSIAWSLTSESVILRVKNEKIYLVHFSPFCLTLSILNIYTLLCTTVYSNGFT